MISPAVTSSFLIFASVAAGDDMLHTIGNPSNEEQYYLELINRARADPEAEGIRIAATSDPAILYAIDFFNVDLELFKREMAAIDPQPPLAMNPILIGTARAHSQDMFAMGIQTHTGSNGDSWRERGIAANYQGSLVVQNIYASSWFTEFGHASFEIDWGPGGSGGMLPGRGHRFSIHYSVVREVGIGIFNGRKTGSVGPIGPQLVTQDFGTGPPQTAFMTGVVYHDLNANDFYDPGEGIGGVKVIVGDDQYRGITSSSGGYSIPVPIDDATFPLEFVGPGIRSQSTANMADGANVKIDLIIPYAAPTITGTTVPAVGIPARYQISPVAGATSYDWRRVLETATPNDPAEHLDRVTPLDGSSSPLLSELVKFTGSHSYHLFHEVFADNALLYNSAFQVTSGAALNFRSRHAYASSGQVASVQVREDGKNQWQTVWSQAGRDNAGENSFRLVNVPLDDYEGQRIQLRLLYDYIPGSVAYFHPLGVPIGWYVDDLVFVGLATVSAESIARAEADGSFEFAPAETGRYRLSSRPVFPDRTGSFGDSLPVDASSQRSFGEWAAANEAALDLPAGDLSGDPEGDLNGDGIANVMAYALGLDPLTPAAHRLPKAEHEGAQIVITYHRHSQRSDVSWGPEATASLETWAKPGDPLAPAGFSDEIVEVNGGMQTRRAVLPISPGNSSYLRMKAVTGGRTAP